MGESALNDVARSLGIEGDGEFKCEECGRGFTTKFGLGQHRRSHKAEPESKPAASPAPSALVVEEVIGRAVANLQVVGGYLSIILPHAGLTIAGVPGETEGDPPVVQSRAIVAGRVLEKWAVRDERVLKALDRFNALFETSEVLELAAGVGAAVAVDIGAVPADLAIEIGPFVGPRAIQPVRAVIGDVVDYVEVLRQAQVQQRRAPEPDGRAPDGAAVIYGGVEDT